MSWHYANGGQQNGPVSDDEFNRLVNTGVVKAETLVWKDGWPDWRAYGTVGSGAVSEFADANSAVCAVSGRRLPKNEMLEFEGRWVGAEHKEEFFQRLREGVRLPQEMVYGGFWRRVGAKIIDSLVVGAVNMALAFVLGLGAAGLTGVDGGRANVGAIIAVQIFIQVLSVAIALGYSLFFLWKFDATPGKMALGLKVFRPDGSKLSKGRIVGRHFAELLSSITLLIGYLMVAFDKEERRALHDRVADTRVVRVR